MHAPPPQRRDLRDALWSTQEDKGIAVYFTLVGEVDSLWPKDERQALRAWEKNPERHSVGTSDWPGWVKYIGTMPSIRQVTSSEGQVHGEA